MGPLKHLALLAVLATAVCAMPEDRAEKSIGIFNIVKFPNDVCESDTAGKSGTCFTAEECSTRDGVASGSCAEGYGVCCIITLACGGSSSDNCTHLSQVASNTPNTDSTILDRQCSYTICPASATINRIRLDFTTFNIAGPVAPPLDGDAAGTTTMQSTLTNCNTDRFAVTGAPVICGVNNGQHMIVDTDGTTCVSANFLFGLANQMRSYEIHVTQFDKLNEMGGYPGCLQFYTENTGTVSTFNWQGNTMSTHLALQKYDVCVRPNVGRCVLCWAPTGTPGDSSAGNEAVGNFGISTGASTAGGGVNTAMSGSGSECWNTQSKDFIFIPNGLANDATNLAFLRGDTISTTEFTAPSIFCGRFLNAAAAAATDSSVCTRSKNFRMHVSFDAFEAAAVVGGDQPFANEASDGGSATAATLDSPLGTAGFELGFEQLAC